MAKTKQTNSEEQTNPNLVQCQACKNFLDQRGLQGHFVSCPGTSGNKGFM